VKKLRHVLFVVALIFSFASLSSAAALPPCRATHTIASADSLAGISRSYFGDDRFAYAILQATNARSGETPFKFIGTPDALPVGGQLCVPNLEEGDRRRLLYESYQKAVQETVTPHPSDVSGSLVKVDPNTPLRAITWIGSYELSAYKPNGNWTTTAPKDIWITAAPYTKNFCQDFVKGHGADADTLTLRLEQLLGLPPGAGKSQFMEITVKDPGNANNLFRPCAASPATNAATCPAGAPPSSNAKHAAWIYQQYYNSFSQATPNLYPWTSLGYTFDWAVRDEQPGKGSFVRFGGSEFVIPKGAPIEIQGVTDTLAYCK
jgi:hypothetical protein